MNKMPGNVCLFVSFRDVDKGGCRQANRLESRSEHNVSSRASFYVPVFYWGRLKKKLKQESKEENKCRSRRPLGNDAKVRAVA
jgi:hypothetical protein